jgi:hypothetical protein
VSQAEIAADAAVAAEHGEKEALIEVLKQIPGFETLKPEEVQQWIAIVMDRVSTQGT